MQKGDTTYHSVHCVAFFSDFLRAQSAPDQLRWKIAGRKCPWDPHVLKWRKQAGLSRGRSPAAVLSEWNTSTNSVGREKDIIFLWSFLELGQEGWALHIRGIVIYQLQSSRKEAWLWALLFSAWGILQEGQQLKALCWQHSWHLGELALLFL